MSTEAQAYSPKIQATAIRTYAELHGLELVRTYLDPGRSGLTLAGRPALRELLSDVTGGHHDYEVLLVYDVSRWGRFQDADESAHYEFILKSAGLSVVYVAEQFDNDGTPFAAVFKSMKRVMAAEFSRELSNKVAAGHKVHAKRGFWQGARPGYGLRRVLVTDERNFKARLKNGERKSLVGDRVVIEPGARREVEAVRYIFEQYIAGLGTTAIADQLDSLRYPRPGRKKWTYHQVNAILTNEKYAGANVFGRTLQRLKRPAIPLPEHQWINVPNAFEPIVSSDVFKQAQSRRQNQFRNWSDEQYLDGLRAIWRREGGLSRTIIDADAETPDSASYYNRFGGLTELYNRVGYEAADLDGPLPDGNLHAIRAVVFRRVLAFFRAAGADPRLRASNQLVLNGRVRVQLHVGRCVPSRRGAYWRMELHSKYTPDFLVFARLNLDARSVRDFYIFPASEPSFRRCLLLREHNSTLEEYRADDLGRLVVLAMA